VKVKEGLNIMEYICFKTYHSKLAYC